ncbi:MAG: class I tRNA ligase family protein, partial [Methylococcales bacterium]|nr:class I tRNA ligase family protein [Methylococcales bacterium]
DRWVVDRAFQLQKEVISAYEDYHFQKIYQKVHHFCAMDLGSFYLDIVKDRQYTAKTDGLARRSAQTAMYHVVEALSRWLAPITCYTADEIWQYIPGQRSESIFLETWYEQLFELDTDATMDREFWEKIMLVRTAVSKEIEQLRSKGDIGSSLNAEVELYCNEEYFTLLNQLSSELHFIFITSNASLADEKFCPEDALQTEMAGIRLKVTASEHKKCVRCWHQRYDVGENQEHPELCSRCVDNIDGDGEVRQFA